jgi:carboxypeptidase Q
MNRIFLTALICITQITLFAQITDEENVKMIFARELSEGKPYFMLEYLSTKIGARLSGSSGADAAVEWSRQVMKDFADTVYLQPVMVPHWVRGEKEIGRIVNSKKRGMIDINICALGGSVGTGASGIAGGIVEVNNFNELKQLGSLVKGKIVFFNRAMDPTRINTFSAYSGAVDQRGAGASEAAKYGAIGVIVRSMASNLEDYPHTGSVRYALNIPKIPAVAVSTNDAELLSKLLKDEKDIQLYIETHCETLEDKPSFNVIGVIKGSEFPNEIIMVSGHLDSWDLGQGAHDDGAGCVQAMEVLRLFKVSGYRPRRTIRAVMFMNEENGLRGGIEYARQAELKKENHILAIESDRGGFAPRGFSMLATESVRNKIKSWKSILAPYGLTDFDQPGGGADIGPLGAQGIPLVGYLPDSQRYFNYHHTIEDTFDKVDKRELELGAASMAALVYLIDQHGLK